VDVAPTTATTDRRLLRGERTRQAILTHASRLASAEGLEAVSLQRLAGDLGISKSGLFAHFGSKEELQLATIETASALFAEQVMEPAAAAPNGLERLRELAELFLRHVENGVYPGGCFFASVAAELDTHPGLVRDRALQLSDEWLQGLEAAIRDAQAEGAIDPAEDAQQLAFELDAYLLLANAQFVASPESGATDRARRALARRLEAAIS